MEVKHAVLVIGDLSDQDRRHMDRELNHWRLPITPPLELVFVSPRQAALWDKAEVVQQYAGNRYIIVEPAAFPPEILGRFLPDPEEYEADAHIPMLLSLGPVPKEGKFDALEADDRGLHTLARIISSQRGCAGLSEADLRRPWGGEWCLLSLAVDRNEDVLAFRLAHMRKLRVCHEETIFVRGQGSAVPHAVYGDHAVMREPEDGVPLPDAVTRLVEQIGGTPVILPDWNTLDYLLAACGACGLDGAGGVGWVVLQGLAELVFSYTGCWYIDDIRAGVGLALPAAPTGWLGMLYAVTRAVLSQLSSRYGVDDMGGYFRLCKGGLENPPLLFDVGAFAPRRLTNKIY